MFDFCPPMLAAPVLTSERDCDLLSLVGHRESVCAEMTVETAFEGFRRHAREFVAVIEGGRFLGLISRGQLGLLLGTRYGFSVHSRHPVREHLLPNPLVVTPSSPFLQVLELALNRIGDAFYRDLALVSDDGEFLGIIPVPALVRAQSRLMLEKVHQVETQGFELGLKNEELRQSEDRYESLFRHSPMAIALLTPDGTIEAGNPRLENLVRNGDGAPGHGNLADLIDPEDRPAFLEVLAAPEPRPEPNAVTPREFRIQLPERGHRLIRAHTCRIQETGQICAVLQDITEFRELEQNAALNEKRTMLETLVGGVAHELNNKLAPVLGFAELLRLKLENSGATGGVLNYCEMIEQSVRDSAKIIQQLRQLSRPVSLECAAVEPAALVEEALVLMQYRLRALDVELELALPPSCPRIWVDPVQIKQVLINLVLNALDAMEKSPVRRLRIGGWVQNAEFAFQVADTGEGIPPDVITRIFDPFFTTKPMDLGTGLGLSVCLGIVKHHKGSIRVDSKLSKGTTFVVNLPLASVQAQGAAALAQSVPVPGISPAGDGRQLNALVVDDEESITALVQDALASRPGWRVLRAHSGQAALQNLQEEGIDLLITDLRMPGLDGFGLLEWVRRERPALYPRTLVITGDAGGSQMDDELADLNRPLLHKPFSPSDLQRMCDALCS
jgi:signal transduction histidine kinase/CBS domain-containing protein